MLLKKAKRQQALQFLKQNAQAPDKKKRELAALQNFLQSDAYANAETLGVFLANSLEFDLEPLITQALADDKKIAAPIARNHQLTFYQLDENTERVTGKFGIVEPYNSVSVEKNTIDLLIVPGLIFNRDGFRIGFGGGYYGRFLVQFSGATHSFLFTEQRGDFTPEPFDIAVANLWLA